jgi:hypothetical protein
VTDGPGERGNHRKKSADNLRVGMSLGGRTAPAGRRGSSVATSGTRTPPDTGGGTAPGGSTGNLPVLTTNSDTGTIKGCQNSCRCGEQWCGKQWFGERWRAITTSGIHDAHSVRGELPAESTAETAVCCGQNSITTSHGLGHRTAVSCAYAPRVNKVVA